MEVTILKALPEDAYNFASCHITCWKSAYKGIVTDEYLSNMVVEKQQRVEKYRKNLITPGECEYYCVMNEKKMIGFIIINKQLKAKMCEIWAIYLIEEFCGNGYGEKLLDFAINELKRVNPNKIFLWVFEANHRARRFYEKNGLSFDGIKREVNYGKMLVQLRYVLN